MDPNKNDEVASGVIKIIATMPDVDPLRVSMYIIVSFLSLFSRDQAQQLRDTFVTTLEENMERVFEAKDASTN